MKTGMHFKRILSIVAAVAITFTLTPQVAFQTHAAETTNVTITKYGYELVNGKENILQENLPGATLEIRDSNGRKVTDFVTGSSPKKLKLDPGKYTIMETAAPSDYEKAVPKDFTVNASTSYEVVSPAQTLPGGRVYMNNREWSLLYGGYKLSSGGRDYNVYCVDSTITDPPTGSYTAQPLSSETMKGVARNITEEQLLRILYVGSAGDARGYGSQFRAAEDFTAEEQFWIATQYAIATITNKNVAQEYYGKYLGPNKDLAEKIKDAADDTSITIPQGYNAYIYVGARGGQQPCVAVSFPTVKPITQQTQVNVRLGDKKKTPDTPTPEGGEFVIIGKVDEKGDPLQGALMHVENKLGDVIPASYYDENGKFLGKSYFVSPGKGKVTGISDANLAPGTYYVVEDKPPAGYEKEGTGKKPFTIEAGSTGAASGPAPGSTVQAYGTSDREGILRGYTTIELKDGSGLAFCINPQTSYPWETSSTKYYSVISESGAKISELGKKTSVQWGVPDDIELTKDKMERVKMVLWATYDFMISGDYSDDVTGIIGKNLGQANFPRAGVYMAAEKAIAELIYEGSYGKIANNTMTGNAETLANALINAAKKKTAYFEGYTSFSIVYLQTDDPASQNLITPGFIF